MAKDYAHLWYHAGAWGGLVATAYTNYRAAPSADLRVGYLAVPVLSALLSEALIRTWKRLPVSARTLLSTLLLALVAVSYEHFVHMILAAGGTDFAAWVGGAVLDLTIFGCVLATCAFRLVPIAVPERSVLVVPADQPEQNSVPAVPEQPEQNALPEQDAVLALTGTEQNSVPDWYVAPEQNRTEHVPAPAFCPPPVLPEQPEQNDEPEQNEPEQNRTSTPRRQNDAAALQLLTEAFGDAVPSTREAQNALKCGASRAERLARIHAEKLSELRT